MSAAPSAHATILDFFMRRSCTQHVGARIHFRLRLGTTPQPNSFNPHALGHLSKIAHSKQTRRNAPA
jgi:hypothetical protein